MHLVSCGSRPLLKSFPIIALAALAGCESQQANPAPCPQALILTEASRLIEFDGPEALENIAYSGEIASARASCRYFEDEPIVASLDIDFAFGAGPKAEATRREFQYFVAVTRKDVAVIEKQVFPVKVRFKRGEDRADVREEIAEIVIPRATERVSGSNFEIIVGLELTEDQLAWNRSGASLKFPEL